MRKFRSILGVLLILLSIAGLLFWEVKGREAILMDDILVAEEEIQPGTKVIPAMFCIRQIPENCMLKDAVSPEDAGLLDGKVAAQYIAKNGQIIMKYFREEALCLKKNESVYVIRPEWIAMRSSALRRGDLVDIYGTGGLGNLGTFRVAYVKDVSEREVESAGESPGTHEVSSILERPHGTSVIDHIEIISTFKEYQELSDHALGSGGLTPAALIIVQRGDFVDP